MISNVYRKKTGILSVVLFIVLHVFFSSKIFAQFIGPTQNCGSGWCLGQNAGSCYKECNFVFGTCQPTKSEWRSWTCSTNMCRSDAPVRGCGENVTCQSSGEFVPCSQYICSGTTLRDCGTHGRGCYTGVDAYGCGTGYRGAAAIGPAGCASNVSSCYDLSSDTMGCCGPNPNQPTPTPRPTATLNPTQPPQQPTQAPPPTQQPSSPTPTPRPPGTFRVRALQVSLADANNCSAPSSPLSSSLSFAPNLPQGTQSSDGTAYASWSAPPGTYTLIPTITAPNSQSFVLQTACVSRNGNLPSSSTLAQNIQSNDVVSYDLLYSLGQGWMRVTGGNVIACTDVSSVVPPSSPFFILNGSGGYPGFLSYGSSVSFDSSRLHRQGIERLSATQWILHNAFPELCDTTQTDFYQLFAYKFDISGIQPLDTPSGIKTKADFPQDITRVIGNVTLGGSPQDWSLSSNEKKTIFVNGNVTIQQNISYPDGGFFALIVNGNITIAPTVGSPHTSSAPSLRGFFATNPTGRFITGQSSNPGTEKLVVLGTVAAGGFTLQRNLDAFTVNHTTPAEEFIYDPSLLFSMPEQFKDVKIKWQEVPP